MAWRTSRAFQIPVRLLLSGAALTIAIMLFLMVAIGFDSERRQGGKLSYLLIALDVVLLLVMLWAIWTVRAGWWQWLWLAVMLPLALGILWMLGVLPCSTRLNCPF